MKFGSKEYEKGGENETRLTADEQIFINQFSQNLHSLEEMDAWFLGYDRENQADILHHLLNMVIRAHPTYEEIEAAAAELRRGRSPVAVKLLNRNKPFAKIGHEIFAVAGAGVETRL